MHVSVYDLDPTNAMLHLCSHHVAPPRARRDISGLRWALMFVELQMFRPTPRLTKCYELMIFFISCDSEMKSVFLIDKRQHCLVSKGVKERVPSIYFDYIMHQLMFMLL